MPIIAEDLGVITPDVVALREAIGAPGMVVLQVLGPGYRVWPLHRMQPLSLAQACTVKHL